MVLEALLSVDDVDGVDGGLKGSTFGSSSEGPHLMFLAEIELNLIASNGFLAGNGFELLVMAF